MPESPESIFGVAARLSETIKDSLILDTYHDEFAKTEDLEEVYKRDSSFRYEDHTAIVLPYLGQMELVRHCKAIRNYLGEDVKIVVAYTDSHLHPSKTEGLCVVDKFPDPTSDLFKDVCRWVPVSDMEAFDTARRVIFEQGLLVGK